MAKLRKRAAELCSHPTPMRSTAGSFVSPDARCFSGVKCNFGNFDWLLSEGEQSAESPRREQPQVIQAQKLNFDQQDDEAYLLGCEEQIDVAMNMSRQEYEISANTPHISAS